MIKYHYVIADRYIFTNQIKIKEFVHKIKRISSTAYYYFEYNNNKFIYCFEYL